MFTTAIGTPIEARNLVRSFKALLERAGLREIRFHDLRHSAATFMLLQGVAAKTVQEVLGHSQYHVTMDTYGHVLDELHVDAAERIGALFGG